MRTAALVLLALVATPAAAQPTPRLRIGDGCPDLTLPRLGGGTLRLSSLRGRLLALSFYSRFCAPCRRELPTLARVVDRVNASAKVPSVVLLAINIDERPEPAAVLARLAGRTPIWLHDREGKARQSFDPQRYPCTFLVDAAGRVRHINRGFGPGYEARVERWLRGLLAASAPTRQPPR